MAARIKTGDRVIVVTGKDKGKQGDVESVDRADNTAIVAGIRMVKRHTKPTQDSPGGIVDKETPIHLSNLALIDPESDKPTRIGFRVDADGKKERFAKRSGASLS